MSPLRSRKGHKSELEVQPLQKVPLLGPQAIQFQFSSSTGSSNVAKTNECLDFIHGGFPFVAFQLPVCFLLCAFQNMTQHTVIKQEVKGTGVITRTDSSKNFRGTAASASKDVVGRKSPTMFFIHVDKFPLCAIFSRRD